ncbi:hypothetical protein BC567DRAFT_300210 [Phyllosticta citribraziliensis]
MSSTNKMFNRLDREKKQGGHLSSKDQPAPLKAPESTYEAVRHRLKGLATNDDRALSVSNARDNTQAEADYRDVYPGFGSGSRESVCSTGSADYDEEKAIHKLAYQAAVDVEKAVHEDLKAVYSKTEATKRLRKVGKTMQSLAAPSVPTMVVLQELQDAAKGLRAKYIVCVKEKLKRWHELQIVEIQQCLEAEVDMRFVP